MASRRRTVEIEVVADTKRASTQLNTLGGDVGKAAGKFQNAGKLMVAALGTAAVAGVSAFVKDSVRAFSELEQSVGGTEAVFGDASGAIDDFAKHSAQSVGLAASEFRNATTLIGGQLKRMTGDVDFAATSAVRLTEIGADLAATYGGTTKEAVDAFAAALRGEADPAERFNLDLKVSKVNAKAVEMGLAKTTTSVDDYAKAQALLALVTEQSADAQGQFAREADTVAGKMQRATAQLEDQKAMLGEIGANPITSIEVGAMKLWGTAITDITNEIRLMKGEITEAQAVIAEWQVATGRYASTTDDARDIAERFGVSVSEVARELGLVDTGTNRHRGSVDKLKSSYEDAEEAVDGLADAQTAAADPAFNLQRRHEAFVESQKKYNAALDEFKAGSPQAIAAGLDLAEAAGDYNAAQQRFIDEFGPQGVTRLKELAAQAGIYGDDLQIILDFLNRIGKATVGLPPLPGSGSTRDGVKRYHSGGYVAGNPGEEVPAVLQAGEFVVPRNGQVAAAASTLVNIHVSNPSSLLLAELMELRRRGAA